MRPSAQSASSRCAQDGAPEARLGVAVPSEAVVLNAIHPAPATTMQANTAREMPRVLRRGAAARGGENRNRVATVENDTGSA
jgi:hypothetical protein